MAEDVVVIATFSLGGHPLTGRIIIGEYSPLKAELDAFSYSNMGWKDSTMVG